MKPSRTAWLLGALALALPHAVLASSTLAEVDPAPVGTTVNLSVFAQPPVGGIAGAEAELTNLDGSGATFRATSTTEGRIAVAGVPPGRYRAVVRKEGYGDAVAPALEVGAASQQSITLLPGGSLTARVTDPAGRSIAGASVCLAPPVERAAVMSPGVFSFTRTDFGPACAGTAADGTAVLPATPYGHYKFSVRAAGFGSIENEMTDLRAGAEPRAIVLSPAGGIAGRLVDPDGQSIAGAKVTFRDRIRGTVVETTTDESGAFRSSTLAAGSWRVEIDPQEQRPVLRDSVKVKASETTDLGTLRGRAAFAISGRLAGPDGSAAVRAEIRAVQSMLPRKVLRTTRTDDNGNFRIAGLASGARVDLLVRPAAGLTAATFRDIDAPSKGLALTLERSGRLTGVVRSADGSVPARAYISAFPGSAHPALEANAGQAAAANVDPATGAFTLDNVPVGGDVEIRVYASGIGDASTRVTLLESSGAAPIEIALSGTTGELQGRVVDPSGVPVAGASLGSTVSDDQGRFRLAVSDAAKSKVTVTHPAFAPVSEDLSKSRDDEPVVVLDPGGAIEGTVTDADGKPLAGVRLSTDTPNATAVSGVGGRYRIEHMPLGSSWVRRQGLGAIGDTEATKVSVEGGQVAKADFRIGAVELSGVVTRGGSPIEGFELSVRQPVENDGEKVDHSRLTTSATDEEGRFALPGLVPGPARLTLTGITETFVLVVDVPETTTSGLELRLPGRVIEGVVLDESGAPLRGAFVGSPIRDDVPAEIAPPVTASKAENGDELEASAWSRAATDAAGKFRVIVDDDAPSELAVCTCAQGCLSVPIDARGEGEAVTLWFDPRLRKQAGR